MLEVVGLIASLITIAQVATESVKYAKTIYRAREELGAIQEQLENFAELIKEIDANHALSSSPAIVKSLSQAKLTIEELNQLIEIKILGNANGNSQARRRTWARNKSKIHQIEAALREHRSNLFTAITANTLSSANRSEAALSSINRNVAHTKETSLVLERQLCEIQKSILSTYNAVALQSDAVQSILYGTILATRGSTHLNEPHCALPGVHSDRSFPKHTIDDAKIQYRPSADMIGRHQDSTRKTLKTSKIWNGDMLNGSSTTIGRSATCQGPASPLEISPCFLPETYSVDTRFPSCCLMVNGSYAISNSNEFMTNSYRVLYLKSPRRWRRRTISITVSRSSTYWAALILPTGGYNDFDSRKLTENTSLPYALQTQVQEFLTGIEDMDEDTQVEFTLTSQDVLQKNQHSCQTQLSAANSNARPIVSLEILASLEDLGCRQYLENELIQVELIQAPSYFVTYVDGKLVYEVKFDEAIPNSRLLYNIVVRHCMSDISGFGKLVGIVTDTTETYLKGYLAEIPQIKVASLSDEVTPGRLIPWSRREKWAKQLIEAVRQAHSKGLVIGTLWRLPSPIVTDSSDCLHFLRFGDRFLPGHNPGCFYPPEFMYLRSASKSTPEDACPKLTPKTDIFHLGLVLWWLVEGFPQGPRSPVCARARCEEDFSNRCDSSHRDPISLPQLSAAIPKYYRDIVNACRAQTPSDRPAAWRLLEFFPPITNGPRDSEVDSTTTFEGMSLSLQRSICGDDMFCNRCIRRAEPTFFHCYACHKADFDICVDCFDRGLHCLENDHLLVKLEKTLAQTWTSTKKYYYSNVKSSGSRDVLEL